MIPINLETDSPPTSPRRGELEPSLLAALFAEGAYSKVSRNE